VPGTGSWRGDGRGAPGRRGPDSGCDGRCARPRPGNPDHGAAGRPAAPEAPGGPDGGRRGPRR
jgi:hypothetical protein